MSGFITIIKMNLKLLLRNKGYLIFLVILPVLSVILLNINNINSPDATENVVKIIEMKQENDTIMNVSNTRMNIKVYDSSNTKLSEYILEEMAKTGSYRIYRYKSTAMSVKEVRKKALESANHNVIGAVIYIPNNFDDEILKGKDSNIVVYEATKDGRIDLMESNLKSFTQSIFNYAKLSNYNKTELIKLLEISEKSEMAKESVGIEVGDALNLTAKQSAHSASMGYALSFLTLSFLFSGIFIAATVVEERQNRVYNRFVLSISSLANYGIVKLIMVIITVLLQTGFIAVGIKLIVKTDYGIPFFSFLFLVFFLGLVFNLFSVVIGVFTNNVMSSNYVCFAVWCLSCLFAGLYFPLDGASKWWARATLLMPQRWVVKASEMLMAGKDGVFSMFLLVMFSFLAVITCIGLLGIKIRRKE